MCVYFSFLGTDELVPSVFKMREELARLFSSSERITCLLLRYWEQVAQGEGNRDLTQPPGSGECLISAVSESEFGNPVVL